MAENRYGFLKLEAKIQGFVTWTEDAESTEMKVTSDTDLSVDARYVRPLKVYTQH